MFYYWRVDDHFFFNINKPVWIRILIMLALLDPVLNGTYWGSRFRIRIIRNLCKYLSLPKIDTHNVAQNMMIIINMIIMGI